MQRWTCLLGSSIRELDRLIHVEAAGEVSMRLYLRLAYATFIGIHAPEAVERALGFSSNGIWGN